MTALRSLVERYMRAFNARDFDAWLELFDEDVEVRAGTSSQRGRAAAWDFADETVRAFPGVRIDLDRVVAETPETIVVEYRLVNADEAGSRWRLEGSVCDIYDVRDGLIVSCHTYYVPDAADRTVLARVPSRIESTRIADEQAALRCVATLVAQGVSQSELFDAVTAQASRLLAEPMALHRFDPDDHATVVAVHGDPAPFGLRVTTVGDGVAANVRRTGRPSRIDDYERVVGGAAQVAREVGLRAAVGAPIVVAGGVWGAIVAMSSDDPLPPGTEDRLAKFAELVATAIANAEAHAALTASRARVVATADDTRRRIERDLHDGAQQRLVHTVIALKLAKAALGESGGREVELIDQALHNAEQATAELHELVHGIMPAALTRGGLRAAVESLLDHVDLPVDVDISPTRLPAAVETTAYFVVAEALTNAVKHAGATSARVRARDDGDALRLEVRDDGAGGAVPARGTGLVGLTDRVAACGGSIAIASPPGEGTTLTVTLPTGHDPAAGDRRIRATERATGS